MIPNLSSTNQPVHASLFNLVAYLPHTQRQNAMQEVLQNIVDKLPCRSIIIAVEESGYEPLRIETTPHLLEKGSCRIVCEQITIHIGKDELAKASFALMPYLLPDLPIYLLWGQNPLEDQVILPILQGFATKLIFDAEEAGKWQAFSKTMLEHLDTGNLEIMDINWAMIGAWRDAFVRLFHTSHAIDQLRHSKKINLCYSGNNTLRDAKQGIYLCSWLAAQLDWSLEKLEQNQKYIQASYRHSQGNLDVTLAFSEESSCDSGVLLSVDIMTGDGIYYELKKHLEGSTVIVHITRDNSCDLPFAMPLPNLWKNLTYMKELFHNASNTHYRNMLYQLANYTQ